MYDTQVTQMKPWILDGSVVFPKTGDCLVQCRDKCYRIQFNSLTNKWAFNGLSAHSKSIYSTAAEARAAAQAIYGF